MLACRLLTLGKSGYPGGEPLGIKLGIRPSSDLEQLHVMAGEKLDHLCGRGDSNPHAR